jgi:NAD(P)-dependent dehydrogenase (short-subunit alcohol dehydrogenase family)
MKGKVMAITGAFGSLGRVVAKRAAECSFQLALIDNAASPADVGSFGQDSLLLPMVDLSDATAAGKAVDMIIAKFGTLDVLLNLAGAFRWEKIVDGSNQTWEFLNRVNVLTAVNASRSAAPYLARSAAGRIVNIGANAALKSAAGMGAYTASKAAVHRLTESLADELKDQGVTVNAVLPSVIDTPVNRRDMPDADFTKWVTAGELAAVILFLASAEASGITGALVPVVGRV